VLRPYGVWVVISPFNFPVALAGGPAGAALVAGNTVVFKPASDTPWTGYFLARCFLDAGLPEGVFNFVTGPGSSCGQQLISSDDVDGITFTGSYDVGMRIIRTFAAGGRWPRPCIAEMGGKNPVIVSRNADLDSAALGCMRSAFGLQGQKCSAASRVFVEKPAYAAFVERFLALVRAITVGDPTVREHWMGPVINAGAAKEYDGFCDELRRGGGRILAGGRRLTEGALAQGLFCAPTVAEAPEAHRLWTHEMFLPVALVAPVDSLDEAMRRANDVAYGLTAGFYGTKKEAEWFFEHIEAGVCYANRPQGATTGAWPGHQPFGGWKGSVVLLPPAVPPGAGTHRRDTRARAGERGRPRHGLCCRNVIQGRCYRPGPVEVRDARLDRQDTQGQPDDEGAPQRAVQRGVREDVGGRTRLRGQDPLR
jgi:1-pyrroline-5-carboxylate dehydrogenase